jgi:hypothetical protein
MMKAPLPVLALSVLLLTALPARAQQDPLRWTRNGAPTETYVSGGPWTLEQSGAPVGLKSAGYCDAKGNQLRNQKMAWAITGP